MPLPLARAKAANFARITRDVGSVFTFSGTEVPCNFGSVEDDMQLAISGGGEMPVYDFTATCRVSDLPGGVVPQKGETVIIDGVTYQIDAPERIPGSPLVKLRFSNLDI